MPLPKSASSTPGPSGAKNMVGDALYAWCCREHDYGHVFMQDDLLESNIIPNRDLMILLSSTQYLVNKHLLKIHDVKGQEGIAWELIAPDIAKSYHGLTTDEQMVYSLIEGSATAGIWTKTIKARLSAHAKVLDRVYKSLEGRQLIKQMKSVKNPGRKMYILFGLQPSEDATGGAWFTEGRLDTEMISAISGFVEGFCSRKSWREITDNDEDGSLSPTRKRKQPDDGFEVTGKGKGKAAKLDGDQQQEPEDTVKNKKQKPKYQYEPHEPGYGGYPTVREISQEILRSNVIESGQALPETALVQLLDVMVYDDRLFKMSRPCRSGETPDSHLPGHITMYRCFKHFNDLRHEAAMQKRLLDNSRSARRAQEIEEIGRGGTSEVPCFSCPNFDICDDGGIINAKSCVYFGQWYERMEAADRENDDLWNPAQNIKPRLGATSKR